MKKILTLCAAVIAAMSMNAQTVMDCDAAYDAAFALNSGDTLTINQEVAIVVVTGYVTDGVNGTISNGQQTFYIGKSANETQKTLQVYKGTMPENASAVNKGDKVKVTGKLMHYVNSSGSVNVAELVRSSVEILEQHALVVDTVSDATICEIISEGESLTAGAYSDEFYEVVATVDSLTYTSTTNKTQTFFIRCVDNGKMLQAYNAAMQDNTFAEEGDTVKIIGKIMHYVDTNRDVVEFNGPNAWVIAKGNAGPKVVQRVTVAQAVTIGNELARKAVSKDEYLIVGYVDSIVTAYNAQYGNITFFMCDDMANPTYDFEVYRGTFDADIPVGTLVYVTGKIQHYYKAATDSSDEVDLIETPAGATVSLTEDAISRFEEQTNSVKVLENGQIYIIKDNVKYSVLGVEVK